MANNGITVNNGTISTNSDALKDTDTIIVHTDNTISQIKNGKIIQVNPEDKNLIKYTKAIHDNFISNIYYNQKNIATNRKEIVEHSLNLTQLNATIEELESIHHRLYKNLVILEKNYTEAISKLNNRLTQHQLDIDSVINNAINDIYEIIRRSLNIANISSEYDERLRYMFNEVKVVKDNSLEALNRIDNIMNQTDDVEETLEQARRILKDSEKTLESSEGVKAKFDKILQNTKEALAQATCIIPSDPSSWAFDEAEISEFKYYHDIEDTNITSHNIVSISIAKQCYETANECGLCQENDTFDGFIRIYAKEIPSVDIEAEYSIFPNMKAIDNPIATKNVAGLVKIGNGFTIDSDGTISLDKEVVVTPEDYINEDTAQQEISNSFNNNNESQP